MSQWFGHGVTCIFIVIGLTQSKGCNPANVGRGLAPDDGGSVSLFVADPLQSGASPLPHLIFIARKVLFSTVHCQPQTVQLFSPIVHVQAACSLHFLTDQSPAVIGTKLALSTGQIHSNNKKVVSCH
ncbi:hypothetical protein [Pseudomonas poae]|uniref:hypothetical protein n=1 Tax=Pseudomonas poae TaxID=200451 RepID=UPI0030CAFA14